MTDDLGPIVASGSSSLEFGERQEAIARLLAYGWSYKKIALSLGLSRNTIGLYVHEMANEIDGVEGSPKLKVVLWYLAHREKVLEAQ